MLKDYDMNVHYNLGKANVLDDALRMMRMGIPAYAEDEKNGKRGTHTI